jgi:hypothetical protein
VKNTLKFLGIGFALVLLVMSQQVSMTQPAEAALSEDTLKFQSTGAGSGQDANATTAGTTVKHYAADDVASFYIKDTQLNVVHTGRTFIFGQDANNDGDILDGDGTEGVQAVAANTVFTMKVHDQTASPAAGLATVVENADYRANAGAVIVPNTFSVELGTYVAATTTNCATAQNGTGPFVATSAACYVDPTITADTTLLAAAIDIITLDTGTFSLAATQNVNDGASETIIANYSFNMADSKAAAKRRAKVTSTSDSTGEYILISEVAAEGSVTAAISSTIFRGQVSFSTDASHAAAGTTSGGQPSVWVQDGDTVTVSYLAACPEDSANACTADGTVTATSTATIDSTKPTITNVSPADGTLTNDTSPVLSFTIEDAGAGFDSSISNFTDHISLELNDCTVVEASELSVTAHGSSSISFSYDLGGTAKFSDDAQKATDTAADSAAATDHLAKKCNDGGVAGNERDITSSGFFIDSTTAMIEDGADGAGHTDGGASGAQDRDRTIHGKVFTWQIIATDEVGNAKTLETTSLEMTIDSVAPAAAAGTPVVAAKAWSNSTLADVTDNSSVKISFTETLDANTVAASDFIVSGTGVTDGTISTVTMGGTQGATNTIVYLDLAADLGPNAKPKVELVGQVSDLAGNVFKVPSTDTDGKLTLGTAADGVKPTVSAGAHTDTNLDALEKTTFTWASNENMVDVAGGIGACTCVYVTGGNADVATDGTDNVKKAATLTSPTTGKVELTQGTAADGVNYTKGRFGVIVAAEDATGNHGIGGITKVASEDVSTYFVAALATNTEREVKLAHWPLADHDGDGDLRDSISAWSENGVAGVEGEITIARIDWTEAETVNVKFTNNEAIAANAIVKFTYHYVSDSHVVEVDTTAPGVTITPANDASSENKRQRITLAFDEDEYAGDTHLTVTVTKAELKDPDAVTTDILASLITSDNKSFYYKPTADLANGGYTVTVSAEDENGNKLTDDTSKFTIKDRSKTTVVMEAGWNLISMPGTPTDTAINTVISNGEVTTVLTYDPTIPGGWLTAVRDGGDLTGTLTTIDASRGYWVYQEDGDDIKVDIPGSSSGVQQVPPSIPLVKGWNLVPMVALNNVSSYIEADDYFANVDWNKAKGWNAATEKWYDIVKGQDIVDVDFADGDTEATDLGPGRGYWIFANKAGTLVP